MSTKVIARRYARALFEMISSELPRKDLDSTLGILEAVHQIFKAHEDFRHLMLSPRFDRETKIRVLRALLEKMLAGRAVVKFFEYLVRKNRLRHLAEIHRAFSLLLNEFRGVLMISVSTAREPSVEEQEQVRQGIASAVGRTVQVQWSANPSLIGGMVAQVGEVLVDGSIRGQLGVVRRRLISPV